jgi:hypothetical protein
MGRDKPFVVIGSSCLPLLIAKILFLIDLNGQNVLRFPPYILLNILHIPEVYQSTPILRLPLSKLKSDGQPVVTLFSEVFPYIDLLILFKSQHLYIIFSSDLECLLCIWEVRYNLDVFHVFGILKYTKFSHVFCKNQQEQYRCLTCEVIGGRRQKPTSLMH